MRKKFERILLTYAKVTVIEIQRLNNLITLILHYYEFNCRLLFKGTKLKIQ